MDDCSIGANPEGPRRFMLYIEKSLTHQELYAALSIRELHLNPRFGVEMDNRAIVQLDALLLARAGRERLRMRCQETPRRPSQRKAGEGGGHSPRYSGHSPGG